MSANKSSLLIDYIGWLFNKYHQLQQQSLINDAFRVVNVEQKKSGQCIITAQIVGKSTTFVCTPQEIVSNDQLLEGFSKKDIRLITYYACNELKQSPYKIIVHEFCEKLNKLQFRLKMRYSTKAIEKTADQISLDKELLSQLNAEDAHLIGYTTATEQMIRERVEMDSLKSTDK